MSTQDAPRITPFLWFNANAEEAVDFYLSLFPRSRRLGELRTPQGSVLTLSFELDGQRFAALNGGPMYAFTEAVSFVIRCESQQEIDRYWTGLTTNGGSEGRCGWCKDRFGLSWQVVPARLEELLRTPEAMQAMMGMNKLNIAALEAASDPAAPTRPSPDGEALK